MARMKKQPKIPTVKQLPSGNWHCSVMVDGRRISITRDSYDECLSCAMDMVSKRIIGEKIESGRFKSVTLRQAIDAYIEARSDVLSPSTIWGYRQIQKHRFKSVMDKGVEEIGNWQELVNFESRYRSPKTVRNAWLLVKSVLNSCEIRVPKVKLPQPEYIEYNFLQPEEIKIFLEIIYGDPHELTFLLALHSLRISEIMALNARTSFKHRTIRVRGAVVRSVGAGGKTEYVKKYTNKSDSSTRDIPIVIPRLQELIDTLPAKELQAMLPNHPDTPRRALERVLARNGFRKLGLHDLRRTFASLGYHLKLSEMEVMRMGGWSDVTTLRRVYTHLADSDLRKAEDKLKAFYA